MITVKIHQTQEHGRWYDPKASPKDFEIEVEESELCKASEPDEDGSVWFLDTERAMNYLSKYLTFESWCVSCCITSHGDQRVIIMDTAIDSISQDTAQIYSNPSYAEFTIEDKYIS